MNKLIDYKVIAAATQGDAVAINKVLKKYDAYINKLASVELKDTLGNTHRCVNEEYKRILQTKLITAILKFEPT